MKRALFLSTAVMLFLATAALTDASASAKYSASSSRATEVTGCLQPGPAAQEYIVQASDGTTWGINEKDLMLNDYVGKTVTVAGDSTHASSEERQSDNASHYLLARDVVVDSRSCQQ
ncbi:MAG: hypothetical protein WBS19_02355 [Candidatus Korobacteraceae bacterium]